MGKKGATPEGVDVFNPLCAQLSFFLNVAERKWKLSIASSDQHIFLSVANQIPCNQGAGRNMLWTLGMSK